MSREYEQRLLGAVLLEPELLDTDKITADLFTDSKNRAILDAARALRESGRPLDTLTLADELGHNHSDGNGYLKALAELQPTAANADYYIDALREEARQRSLSALGMRILEAGKNGAESEETLGLIETEVLKLRSAGRNTQTVQPSDAIREVISRVEARIKAGAEGPTGIPTGFTRLDYMTGGFQPGDLVLVAARTSVGKSSLALSWIQNQIARDIPVSLASLEMPAVSVWERLLSMRSLVNTGRLRFGHLDSSDFSALMTAAGELEGVKLAIIDKPDLTLRTLGSWVLGQVGDGARILYVDYAGLLQGGNPDAPRWERFAEISRGLKAIARESRVPLVALCQLNREASDAREPGLHNIRDSGALEQDADLVLLLTRTEKGGVEDSIPAKLIIAKHRNGPTGRIDLVFRRSLTQFRETES